MHQTRTTKQVLKTSCFLTALFILLLLLHQIYGLNTIFKDVKLINSLSSKFLPLSRTLVTNASELVSSEQDKRLAVLQKRAFASSGPIAVDKPIVIWSNDFHISPIHDLKYNLQPLGVKFIDKSLSSACHQTNTCGNLKVVNQQNALSLNPKLLEQFYQTYKNDSEMVTVDAYVCFHPPSMCEYFMPFNKSLLVIASLRYELGRESAQAWTLWNEHLTTISKDPKNIVAANNLYDAKYIEYFTGIKTMVLPSICQYIPDVKYNSIKSGYLLAPIHKNGFQDIFLKAFRESCNKTHVLPVDCKKLLQPLRSVYPHYKYADLAAHQGIVYVPYQVSVMSMFEQYAMGIPLFFPSLELLSQWHLQHQVVMERTWPGTYGRVPANSTIPPHPSQAHVPDPNCETDLKAIKYWLQFSDFYQLPHVILYDSYDDLILKLQGTHLSAISSAMVNFTKERTNQIMQKWRGIMFNVAKYSENKPI